MDDAFVNSEEGDHPPTTATATSAVPFHPTAPLPPHTVNNDTGLDEFTCPVCSKIFSGSVASGGLKSNFRRHLRTHADPSDTAARPYECPQCQLRFTTSSNLKRHVKTCAPSVLEDVVAGFTRTGGGGQTGKVRRDVSATRESVRAAVSVIRSRHMGDGDDINDGCVSEDGVDIGAATSVGSFLPIRGSVRGGGGHKRSRMDAPDFEGGGGDDGERSHHHRSHPVDSRLNHAPSLLSLNQLSGAAGGGRGGFEVVDEGAGIRGAFGIVMPTQMSYSPHLLPQQPPCTPVSGLTHPTTSEPSVPLSPLALGATSLHTTTASEEDAHQQAPATSSNSQLRFRFGLPFELSTVPRDDMASSTAAEIALTTASLFSCPFCDKQFVWRNSMTQHITLHHRSVKESFVCGLCQASLSSRTKLRRHQRYHCPFVGIGGGDDDGVDGVDGGEQDNNGGEGGEDDNDDDDDGRGTANTNRSSVVRAQVTEVRTYAPVLPPLTVAGWAEAVEEQSGFTLGGHTTTTNNTVDNTATTATLPNSSQQDINECDNNTDDGDLEDDDDGRMSTSTSVLFMGNRTQSDGFNSNHHASPASYTVRQFPNPDFGIKIEDDAPNKKGTHHAATPSSDGGSGGMEVSSRVVSSRSVVREGGPTTTPASTPSVNTTTLVTGLPQYDMPHSKPELDLSCTLCTKVFTERRYLKAHMVRCVVRQQKKLQQQRNAANTASEVTGAPSTSADDAPMKMTTPTTTTSIVTVHEEDAVLPSHPTVTINGAPTTESNANQPSA